MSTFLYFTFNYFLELYSNYTGITLAVKGEHDEIVLQLYIKMVETNIFCKCLLIREQMRAKALNWSKRVASDYVFWSSCFEGETNFLKMFILFIGRYTYIKIILDICTPVYEDMCNVCIFSHLFCERLIIETADSVNDEICTVSRTITLHDLLMEY